MCPGTSCGPLCNSTDPSCLVSNSNSTIYDIFKINNTNEGLVNFTPPVNSTCPNECCSPTNEYCFRMYDNTGNQVDIGDEMMLVFGGMTQNEVEINGINIADSCNAADGMYSSKIQM